MSVPKDLTIHTYPWLTTDAYALLEDYAALRAERDEWKASQQVAKNEYLDMAAEWDRTKEQLAASEQRCTIFEEALNKLQNAILDAQHLLDKEI